ncbi:hypothetical protein [Oceanicoccus sp. KOV_DT_Chl]|uniref:hypothetical protein n=1 Tax=Oceanicoccus sp. KOV_DT_Chl TaxID=1904639 RepID=UPI000C79F4A8|nr:hypothetical protein [Oceanicoccus sp. KOV_DT_Chl]
MDHPLYDIYFTGQLVEGTDVETAKINVAKLFKSTPEKMAKLFTGKPQALKRGVDKAGALKYKAALHQAGLLVAVKTQQAAAAANTASATPAAPVQAQTESTTQPQAEEDWSLAAVGSDVLKQSEKSQPVENNVDTSAIKMVSAFMEPEAIPTAPPPPPPDTSHISVATVGEDLLVEKPDSPPPLPLDIDDITLAPAGSELEQIPSDLPPLNPDTSAISMAEPGADILEGQTKPEPPPAPDTTHLSIAND